MRWIVGWSLRFSYSKLISDTKTNIALSAYRYSSRGFYSFSDAQTAEQALGAGGTLDAIDRARSQWLVNVNQTLPHRLGNFYLTASVRNYWQNSGTTTQFQGGYTNHFRLASTTLSYSISAARQVNAMTGKPDTRVQANFSLPLGHSPHSPMLSTSSSASGAS